MPLCCRDTTSEKWRCVPDKMEAPRVRAAAWMSTPSEESTSRNAERNQYCCTSPQLHCRRMLHSTCGYDHLPHGVFLENNEKLLSITTHDLTHRLHHSERLTEAKRHDEKLGDTATFVSAEVPSHCLGSTRVPIVTIPPWTLGRRCTVAVANPTSSSMMCGTGR